MRAISYVASPDLLFDFFDKHGYSEIEIVVGENLSDDYRNKMEQKGIDVVEQLLEMMEKGTFPCFCRSKKTVSQRMRFVNTIVCGVQDILYTFQAIGDRIEGRSGRTGNVRGVL